MWHTLTASGYGGLRKEDVAGAIHDLLQETRSVDLRHLRPEDVIPYRAMILANLADECAAATRFADAVAIGIQAIGLWRHITAVAPEAGRHDLITRLLNQAHWLGLMRQPDKALAINEEAIRHCRTAEEHTRTTRLSQLLHNHYAYLCRAKRRDKIGECLRTIRHEFAAGTYSTFLTGVAFPFDPADLSTVRDMVAHYDNLPADDPARLPGRVVAHCAHARLLAATGQRDQARDFFNEAVLRWVRWAKQSKSNLCAALAIGMEMLEIAELLGLRIAIRSLRVNLKLPRR